MPASLILVIEDEADSRETLAELLAIEGYRVITAEDGQSGLDLARADQPALILLDLHMPVMDGKRFRQEQARDPLIAHIPVLVVSADDQARAIASAIGASGCVPKPVMFGHLMESVGVWCD